VRVSYGQRSTAHFLLRGECLGTQADLRGGLGCTDTAGVRVPVAPAQLRSGIVHTPSQSGSWAGEKSRPCGGMPHPSTTASGTPLHDEEVCISGGAFLVGNSSIIGLGQRNGTPGQPAVVDPFYLDRYEFTVARYRQALKNGFVPPDDGPTANDGDLATNIEVAENQKFCTFSTAARGRESMPLNCVTWNTARALCRFLGGDLPSHVGWEYAAVAHPDGDSYYPWGDQPPDCCRSAWGRGYFDTSCTRDAQCPGIGPVPVDAEPWASHDISAFNVSGMGGNLIEYAADAMEPYTSPCWWQHPLRGVGCQEAEAPSRSGRGGAWPVNGQFGLSAGLASIDPGIGSTGLGFRCARLP
jgi:formylglycine-generating enzyme required for sulfatase activity